MAFTILGEARIRNLEQGAIPLQRQTIRSLEKIVFSRAAPTAPAPRGDALSPFAALQDDDLRRRFFSRAWQRLMAPVGRPYPAKRR
jgi:hypothetical protein